MISTVCISLFVSYIFISSLKDKSLIWDSYKKKSVQLSENTEKTNEEKDKATKALLVEMRG